MSITDYYGKKKGTPYLDIYTRPEDGGPPIIHRRMEGQQAYDWYSLSLYFSEILADRALLERQGFTLEEIPRKEKNLLLYLLLIASRAEVVTELGSALFEMVDGLEVVRCYASRNGLPDLDPQGLSYHGIDISPMLTHAARELHPDHDLTLYPDIDTYTRRGGVLYDRNVTNYAFESAAEVAAFLNRFDAALLNIYVSLEATFTTWRLGKQTTYFSLTELLDALDKPLVHLFGERAPGPFEGPLPAENRAVVEGFYVLGDPSLVASMVQTAETDRETRAWFEHKAIHPKPAADHLRNSAP